MVASHRMRAIRELPLLAPLLLVALAVFFGGGPGDGSLVWLGGGALLALLALVATRGLPTGARVLLPLAALGAWAALSILWSTLPDRSWDYADRTLVYLLFAALGLWFAGRTRELALGLAAILGAVVLWSLAGKVVPPLYGDYGRLARLRGPVGLWNQLALLADFALPLALWRRGRTGTLLAYAWIVALLLTYSRGGILTGAIVVAAFLALTDERLESAATLVAAAVPAAVVVGIAFALPGVTGDGRSSHVRWHDGLVFGALLLVGAAAALVLERLPRPRITAGARRGLIALGAAGALAVVVVAALAALKGAGSAAVGNGGSRVASTSSNFRFVWWREAWNGWLHHKLAGTGAGSFHLTNLRFRTSYLDFATEPHNLPLQFLSEVGVIGLALFLLTAAAFLVPGRRRRGHELALALVLPAFLIQSLVDIDWDFVAVSAPAFLVAGALAGRTRLRRVSPFGSLALAGVGLLVFGALLLPWLGRRWSGQAEETLSTPRAVQLANRARSVDPLLIEPLITLAFASQDRPGLARGYFDAAIAKQPENPKPLLLAGQFALDLGCARLAYSYLEPFTERDPYARPSDGPDDYRTARALVNSGKPRC
jgi:O-antigen ligase